MSTGWKIVVSLPIIMAVFIPAGFIIEAVRVSTLIAAQTGPGGVEYGPAYAVGCGTAAAFGVWFWGWVLHLVWRLARAVRSFFLGLAYRNSLSNRGAVP